jgi:two-component system, sensor histidine kinase and response regulator
MAGILLHCGVNLPALMSAPPPGLPEPTNTESAHTTAWMDRTYIAPIAAVSTSLLVLGSLLLWRQKRLALIQAGKLRFLAANLRRSQEALRQSEERFRRAFEEGPVGIILASPKSLVLRANRTLCEMLGYSEEELLGLGLLDLVHPEDAPQLLRAADRLFGRELVRYQLQQRFIRHDKAVIWTKITASLLTNPEGRPLYALAIIEDVTDQKRAERTLEENERRFRTLIEKSSDALSLFDANGQFLWDANSATHRHLGYTPEDLIGRTALDLLHPEDREPMAETFRQILAQPDQSPTQVYRLRAKTGEYHWMEGTATNLLADPVIRAVVITERNITERKNAEESIRKSEERFQLIARATNDTIWDWDLDTNRVWWNEGIKSVFGYPAEAVDNDGHWWDQHIHPEDQERILGGQRAVIDQGGHFWSDEYRYRRADGSYADVYDRAYVTRDAQGRAIRMIGAMMDITSRKQAEKELAHARDEAVEVARLKSEFLANISHEVRTPLNGIIGMTVLLDDSELHPEQRNFVETIKTCSEVLLRIINDILDFSKMEAGKICFEALDFNLRQTVESTIEVLADRADRKHVELVLLIDANVPVQLRGDPGRLRQILMNLVVNAIKFTEHGEVIVRVALENESETQVDLGFTVKDTGVGIPPNAMPYLFQAFSQVDGSTTRRYGGTGLGLAISKNIVEMMGGQIGVQSTPGQGSTFWFTVRLQKQPHACPMAQVAPSRLSGLRILVVDDNEANRNLLAQQASFFGMRPTAAGDGPEALQILRAAVANNQPYPLAILDLQMAEMDGLTLAQLIKTDPSLADTRLLLLTSRISRNDTSIFRAAGIGSFMLKPVKQQELFDRISGLMASPSQHETRFWLNRHSGPATSPQLPRQPSAKPVHVLVAEDNPINQRVAVALLAKLGYQAEAVASGPEVLHALEAVAYDVVFMDCQLPELDGFETTREIRRRELADPNSRRRVHIIAMTAYALRGARDECLAAGMDDYLTKPVRIESLLEALNRISANDLPPAEIDPPPPSPGDDILDPTVIEGFKGLQLPHHPNPARELIDLFLQDAPARIREMDRAAARYDAHQLERIAHSLRGSASSIGAMLLSRRCGEVEEKAAARALQEATHSLSHLKADFDKTAPALKSLRDKLY